MTFTHVMVGYPCTMCNGTGYNGSGIVVEYTEEHGHRAICPQCNGAKVVPAFVTLREFTSVLERERDEMSKPGWMRRATSDGEGE